VYEISLKDIHAETVKFGMVFSGQIAMTRPGLYTFSLISNDGNALFIDGPHIINNDGFHGAREKSGRIRLSTGLQRVLVTYFQPGGGIALEAFYSGPGVPWKKFQPPYCV